MLQVLGCAIGVGLETDARDATLEIARERKVQ